MHSSDTHNSNESIKCTQYIEHILKNVKNGTAHIHIAGTTILITTLGTRLWLRVTKDPVCSKKNYHQAQKQEGVKDELKDTNTACTVDRVLRPTSISIFTAGCGGWGNSEEDQSCHQKASNEKVNDDGIGLIWTLVNSSKACIVHDVQ